MEINVSLIINALLELNIVNSFVSILLALR